VVRILTELTKSAFDIIYEIYDRLYKNFVKSSEAHNRFIIVITNWLVPSFYENNTAQYELSWIIIINSKIVYVWIFNNVNT
jgi:hypothetical protein